jgi:transcriptional regulator with XRE-family HTH domain
MSQAELSELSGVSASTVKRLETSPETRGSVASLFRIEGALEQAGVEFISGDESKGPGVRLKRAGSRSKVRNPKHARQ